MQNLPSYVASHSSSLVHRRPPANRVSEVSDELDEVYDTDCHLLYVAATRARDRLLVSGVAPGSEFLTDMVAKP